jgi:hypothetical protein
MRDQTLMPDSAVARRYGVHTKTLTRWDNTPELGFPPPVRIRRRRYRSIVELEAWDARNSRAAAVRAA